MFLAEANSWIAALAAARLVSLLMSWVLTGVLCALALRAVVEFVVARPQYSLRDLLLYTLAVAVDLSLFTFAAPL